MEIIDTIGLPQPILEALKADPYSKGEANASITGLITPPRITQYIERLGDKLKIPAHEQLYALQGSAMHSILERAAGTISTDTYKVEGRLFAKLDGWTLSGQIDILDLEKKKIQDYKNCSYWVAIFGDKEEWTQQLNGYRWLAKQNGYDIDHLEVVAMFRDWSKMDARRKKNKDYPQEPMRVFPITVWSLEKTEIWLKDRIKQHKEAAKLSLKALPLCTVDERWEGHTQYAVEITGESKARRVLPLRSEALSWIAENLKPEEVAKAKIALRNGEPRRCMDYCPVRFHCDYGKKVAR